MTTADVHTCVRGPVCGTADDGGYCDHQSCMIIDHDWHCAVCEAMEPYGFCPQHGYQAITDGGSSAGYAGGSVWWVTYACGCQDMDDTSDSYAAR